MIISRNWLKKYTNIDIDANQLADLIGSRLVEVESAEALADKYSGIYVAKVVSVKKLEDSDHLSVVMIDDSGKCVDVERNDRGLVQVVCGAPNVREGLTVVWLPPGTTVPETYKKDPFVLSSRPIRGVVSNGMLASAKELDLFDDHSGILELDESLNAGSDLSSALELDDFLFDIENKSLTHRPDTFGVIGFAREVSAIQGNKFESPEWLRQLDINYETKDSTKLPSIFIDDPDLSAQYAAVVLTGADSSRKSPLLIQSYLARIGLRPISAPVDVTNYLMMASAQPMHTFDYDKLVALSGGKPEIHVRLGRPGEKLLLLDDKEIEVTNEDIVISAGDIAIGLAGGMGCKNTAIDENTKNILLEVATFNLYRMRSTQMRHGIFSEAITRFTKGQPSAIGLPVLHEAVRLLGEWSGAEPVSEVVVAKGNQDENKPVWLEIDDINKILGTNMTVEEAASILERTEFTVKAEGQKLEVLAPFWRTDINIVEDVVEEVGRIAGYDSITPTLPRRQVKAVSPTDFDVFVNKIKQLMARAGANEVYTYSFVNGDNLDKNKLDKSNSYKIVNAISPELQYYRQSLTPGLLGLVHPNTKAGFEEFALFELNKVHQKSFGLSDEGLPNEKTMLAMVVSEQNKKDSSEFYRAKQILNFMLDMLGIKADFESIIESAEQIYTKPYEQKRSAIIYVSGAAVGVVGEYKNSVRQANKLTGSLAGFELDVNELFNAYRPEYSNYEPPTKYPSTERDICFKVDKSQTYGAIEFAIKQSINSKEVRIYIEPVDIYMSEGSSTKNITIKLRLEPTGRTLTGEETNEIVNKISNQVCTMCHASVI